MEKVIDFKRNILKKIFVMLMVSMYVTVLFPSNLVMADDRANTIKTIDEAINKAGAWMLEDCKEPCYSKEWYIIGLVRSGYNVDHNYCNTYYGSVEEKVKNLKGKFRKVTDLERVIIALTAIGRDPKNVGGYDLINTLWNYDNVTKQGLNGPVFALIALDTNKYKEPEGAVNTRDSLLKEILKYKTEDGGFSLNLGEKKADVDMTAMTLQALSNYKDRPEIKEVIDSSLKILSEIQLENGGYYSPWSGENVQSPDQVIVALSSLGIDLKDENSGFVKKNGDLLSYILTYQNANGAFEHPKDNPNGMATEQSLYTLAAYKRLLQGKNKLYDMTDVSENNEEVPKDENENIVPPKDENNGGNAEEEEVPKEENKNPSGNNSKDGSKEEPNKGETLNVTSNASGQSKKSNVVAKRKSSGKAKNDKAIAKKEDKEENKDAEIAQGNTEVEKKEKTIDALKTNNQELRGTINEVQRLYSKNMTIAVSTCIVLILVSNIITIIFMRNRFKKKGNKKVN